MKKILGAIINSSIKNLHSNQPDLLTNTTQTTMTEWNIGHHLSNEIGKYIFWLNNDLDVVKRNYDNKRPDIIFHRRGDNTLNFLVIEIKINTHLNIEDVDKVKEKWMQGELSYRYGACLSFSRNFKYKGKLFATDGEAILLNEEYIVSSRKNDNRKKIERIEDINYLEDLIKKKYTVKR